MSKNIFYKDCCDKFVDYVKKSHITTQNEPKSEKATQDVQKNCLSLTEQWKKGELPEGGYYVKLESGKIDLYFIVYDDDNCDEIVEIIAPVPSYEEWEQLQNWADFTNDYHELREKLEIADYKNAELKELLKECRKYFDGRMHDFFIKYILNKIDEALK